jgi:hypothetical protein
MITSDLILKYRRRFNDLPTHHQDKMTGDGVATSYSVSHFPIKESTFQLYVNNSLLATSGYTIDLDTGDIELASATSYEIKARYQSVSFRDQHWLEFIQEGMSSFGDRFYSAVMRSPSGMSLSAGVQVYDCPSACIRLTEVLESDDYTLSGNWVKPRVNLSYDRRSNTLVLGQKPSKANYLEISYLARLTKPTDTSSVITMEEDWYGLLGYKVGSIQALAFADRIAKQGNVSVEEGAFSVAQLRQLANDNEAMFERSYKRIKPVLPSYTIPYYIPAGGQI